VPEQILHRADVVAALEEMRREGVAQRMAAHGLDNARRDGGALYRPAERVRMDVVPSHHAAARILRPMRRREHELPGPFEARPRVLPRERMRQPHLAEALLAVALVQCANLPKVRLQRLH
jgi:hypothetical protein